MRFWVFFVVGFLLGVNTLAQEVWMHPNRGQWEDPIRFKVELNQGEMFIENKGFTFHLNNGKSLLSHHHEGDHDHQEEALKGQVIRSTFIGSSWDGKTVYGDSSTFYRNYILGNDPTYWKGNIHSYDYLELSDFYPQIDLLLDGKQEHLKYSFRAFPGADASKIIVKYQGQDSLEVDENGNLKIHHRFGAISESKPVAWQEDASGQKRDDVLVEYHLDGDEIRYFFPNGFDSTHTLVIDPSITFSTFSGSTADNWGMSATPDMNGNLIGGGTVFSSGYPITTGAYDATFNGGSVDLAITKFNATGTSLLFSTYIGGNGSETPNSMICSATDELYIFGITSSSNFPMAGASFDGTYNGGPNVANHSSGLGFSEGSDIFVLRLNATGTNLIASTYVGGSGTDGFNISNLNFNYGDQYRGEIILDSNNNVYVASTSQSSDFPTVLGPQGALSGLQDAVVFKMPPTLNTLLWSGYFGGTGVETGNSIQVAANGDVYVAGGTSSAGLPFPMGEDLIIGGSTDGYVARLNGATGGILSGTYIGMNEYDQAYFVQLDVDDDVYVLGQSESNLGITPGHYGVANSGQFIQKFNHNLTNLEWKTMIGAGTGHVEISPTAFLVSDCYDIYLSGWGGQLNVVNSQATNSTSNGFPITSNAFQSTTNGSNFYIAVLDHNAMNLKYGTYMGGLTSSFNHVDGGTCRFDKSGRIYHAVCGGCGGNANGFSTTPGVWSTTNQSSNCNLAAFKFELSTIDAIVALPTTIVCLPDPIIFSNNSSNGNAFFWDFGDNTTSTDVNPSHVYPSSGNYTVTLVVSDTTGCFSPDSVQFDVFIGDFTGSVAQPTGPICPGDSYQLEAFGGSNYVWSPANVLDDPFISNPTATVDVTTDFMVIISDTCGVDTVYVTLQVFTNQASASQDVSVCIGNSTTLSATGGVSYLWSPGTFLSDSTSASPICTPDVSTTYIVEILTSNNCLVYDTVHVDVYYTPPLPVIPESVNMCLGSSAVIEVSGAEAYSWSPPVNISPLTGSIVTVNPTQDMYYYCVFTNACGSLVDSVFVDVIEASIVASKDTIICPGESAQLWATGGVSYSWTPANLVAPNNTSLVTVTPAVPTSYVVTGVDQYGCLDDDTVFVDLFPQAFIQTSPDVHALYGDFVQLSATSTTSGVYIWSPSEFLSCVSCVSPVANPNQNYVYTVSYTDENGCSAMDSVRIYYDPIIYVPNTFTPNDDSKNVIFKAEGGNVRTFEMTIYNRWGELIFTSDDMDLGWDGTYNGAICQDGTYVWKIKITDFSSEEHRFVGHVNLIR